MKLTKILNESSEMSYDDMVSNVRKRIPDLYAVIQEDDFWIFLGKTKYFRAKSTSSLSDTFTGRGNFHDLVFIKNKT